MTDVEKLYKECENEYVKNKSISMDDSIEIIHNLHIITHYILSKDKIWHSVRVDKRRMIRTQNLILDGNFKNEKFIDFFKFIRNYFITQFIQKHFEKQQVRALEKIFPKDIVQYIEAFI